MTSRAARTVAGRGTVGARHCDAIRPSIVVSQETISTAAAYRPRAAALAERITDRITHEVSGFSDPRLVTLITTVIREAIDLFVDAAAGAPARGHEVAHHYRALGRAEARAGHNLDAMRAAHHIATQETWEAIDAAAAAVGLSAETLHHLTGAALDFQNRLHDQAVAAHAEAMDARRHSRARLVAAVLDGAEPKRLRDLAPDWTVPAMLAVAMADDVAHPRDVMAGLDRAALATVRGGQLIVVVDSALVEDVAASVATSGETDVAISWGVEPGRVPHAHRWACRALRLASEGEIPVPADRIIRCGDHRFALWQHADPELSHQMVAETLGPLLAEKPAQLEVLAETMLLWLQTRASAPVMAARLGVHDQTVRHRLRRIRAMFGDALDQPDRAAELIQALQTLRGASRR